MRTNMQVVLALVASAGFIGVVHAQAKVDLEYKPQKPDGSLGGGVQFKYDIRSQKSAARTAEPGSKGAGPGQGQAGFGYGSEPGSKADAGAKGKGTAAEAAAHGKGVAASASGGKAGGAKNELNPTQARQTPKTDFGSVMRDGLVIVPDVAKTPTPGGPVPLPYPNTPIDVNPPVVKAPLPILRPIETPRLIVTPTLPIAQPVPVAPKPVIVEPVPQPAIKIPYSAPVNRR
jgi:hypothetical protein